MKRPVITVLLLCAMAAAAFGAPAPKKVLSAKDIDSFIANYEAMTADFEAMDNQYEELFAPVEGETVSAMVTRFRSITVPSEIQAIMKKYGLGANGFEKMMVITLGYASLAMEDALAQLEATVTDQPEMAEYVTMYKDQLAEFKTVVHPDDIALLKARQADLALLLGAPAYDDSTETTYEDSTDSSYTDDDYSYDEDSGDDEDSTYGD